MSRIRSRHTQPELLVRQTLYRAGFRYRLHRRDLPGKPDIVLSKYRIAIFVHGCFWHQQTGCIDCSDPKTNTKYWRPKLLEQSATGTDLVGRVHNRDCLQKLLHERFNPTIGERLAVFVKNRKIVREMLFQVREYTGKLRIQFTKLGNPLHTLPQVILSVSGVGPDCFPVCARSAGRVASTPVVR